MNNNDTSNFTILSKQSLPILFLYNSGSFCLSPGKFTLFHFDKISLPLLYLTISVHQVPFLFPLFLYRKISLYAIYKKIIESSFSSITLFSSIFNLKSFALLISPSRTEFCIQLRYFLPIFNTLLTRSSLISYTIIKYTAFHHSSFIHNPSSLTIEPQMAGKFFLP